MLKKSTLIKGCLLMMAVLFSGVSFSSAGSYQLNIKSVQTLATSILKRNIMPVHFSDNGNYFGGFIYFSNGTGYEESLESGEEGEPEENLESNEIFTVELQGAAKGKECKKQMKGFYYNAERGERLWPIDLETAEIYMDSGYMNTGYMETTGGIYTLCRPEGYSEKLAACESADTDELQQDCVDKVDKEYAQDNAYYGMLTHTLTGVLGGDVFYLLAGVGYEKRPSNTWVSVNISSDLTPNFIRFKNKIPVGFVYDNNGGVGFVGCRIESGFISLLSEIVSKASDSILNGGGLESLFAPDFDDYGNEIGIKYVGHGENYPRVDCSDIGTAENSLIKLVIEGLVGMNRESDLGVIGNQTNSKMQYFSSSDINNATLLNYGKQKSEILCRGKWNNNDPDADIVCLNNDGNNDSPVHAGDHIGKTLVVKNRDVAVSPATNSNETGHYDIFINSGNLIIDETNAYKFVFNKNGFIMPSETIENFNDVISGSYFGGGDNYSGDLAAVASFIRGNFIVDGKIKVPEGVDGDKLNNKYFIYGKFTTKDSFNELEDKFGWRCNNGYTTDGSYCPPSRKENGQSWTNPYENAFLVVIDQNYDSLLFGQ